MTKITKVTNILIKAKHVTVFTGAGISVESGIPPFRGENGLWSKYDMSLLDINFFYENPGKSWEFSKEIFYKTFENAKPNSAHYDLSIMENMNIIKTIITQNIDNLHREAGSKSVLEFHGNSKKAICLNCGNIEIVTKELLKNKVPKCSKCGGILKPDFVFFGEGLDNTIYNKSFYEAELADVFLLIGTTGMIQPASIIPYKAKDNGAIIIEINPERSKFTDEITDIFINKKATVALEMIVKEIRRLND